jgi:DNA-binding NarL/FixJ family response regulator
MMSRPRILLADDHALVLAGFRKLLEPEFEIVGTVEDGRALVEAAIALKPDVILLDISMPLLNGIDAAVRVKQVLPETRLVFITMHSEPDYVAEAFRAGGAGYLLKRSAASELATAIHHVLRGELYVTPLVSLEAARGGGGLRLTPRQREVLQLVAEGRSTKEIAGILGLSVKTVEFHKSALMQKLRLHTTAELTKYAIERGLIGV